MSKRSAQVQGSKEGGFLGDGSAQMDEENTARRATSVQLAQRKIKAMKGRLNKGTSSTPVSSGFSLSTPQSQQPFGGSGFQTPNGQQQPQSNPFGGFGQSQGAAQPAGGAFGQSQGQPSFGFQFGASQSFPAPQASNANNQQATTSFPPASATSGNLFGNFNPTPPSSSFNFASPVNNPFSTPTTTAPAATNGTGFTGSLFNVPPVQQSQPTQPTQPTQSAPTSQPPQAPQKQATEFMSKFQPSTNNSNDIMHISPQASPAKADAQDRWAVGQGSLSNGSLIPMDQRPKKDMPTKSPGPESQQQKANPFAGLMKPTATNASQPEQPKSLFGNLLPPTTTSAGQAGTSTTHPTFGDFGPQFGASTSGQATASPTKPAFNFFTPAKPATTTANDSSSPAAKPPSFLFAPPSAASPFKPAISTRAEQTAASTATATATAPSNQTTAEQAKPAFGLFSSTTPAATTAEQAGTTTAKPPPSLFAPNSTASPIKPSTSTTSNLFSASASKPGASTTSNLFSGGSMKPATTGSLNLFAASAASSASSTTKGQKVAASTTNNLFAPSKSASADGASTAGDKPAPSSLFKPATTNVSASPVKPSSAPAAQPPAQFSSGPSLVEGSSNPMNVQSPANLSASQQTTYRQDLNFRALNFAFKVKFAQQDDEADLSEIMKGYLEYATSIRSGQMPNGTIAQTSGANIGSKRKAEDDVTGDNKRKATDGIVNEGINAEAAAKKAKGDDQVNYPKVPSSTQATPISTLGSSTSNIFKNLAENDSGGAPSLFKPNTNEASASSVKPAASQNGSQAPSAPSLFVPAKAAPASNGASASTTASPFKMPSGPTSTASTTTPAKPAFEVPKFGAQAQSTASSGFQPPKFGAPTSAATNFMSQFAKAAADTEKKEKEKRKAEDFDSDEDDEAEWERKYEEEQRAKKQKIEEMAKKAKAPVFSIGGAASAKTDTPAKTPFSGFKPSREGSPASTTGSVFDSHKFGTAKNIASNNIFGHLSEPESGAEGGKDQDDEDSGSSEENTESEKDATIGSQDATRESSKAQSDGSEGEALEEAARRKAHGTSGTATPASGGSLFDRITKGPDGKPERELPSGTDNTTGNDQNGGSIFGSSIFGNSTGPFSNNTWKPDSPIKFGSGLTAFSVTPASPAKPISSIFGAASQPASGAATPSATSGLGFGFGGPSSTSNPFLSAPDSSQLPSGYNSSLNVSRASTPGFSAGETSAVESANDSAADAESNDPQNDLTALTAEEKAQEDVLFEGKSKAMKFNKAAANGWESPGVGILRLMKHKSTGVVRLLMRMIPNGKPIVNVRILPQPPGKKANDKTVQLVLPKDGELQTWIFRFGKAEAADALLSAYEENKPNP